MIHSKILTFLSLYKNKKIGFQGWNSQTAQSLCSLYNYKISVFKAGIHRVLTGKTLDRQKQYDLDMRCLSRLFCQATSVQNFTFTVGQGHTINFILKIVYLF